MNYSTAESEITRLINEEMKSRRTWVLASQVTHLPYAKTKEKYFLLINVNVRPDKIDRETVLAESLTIAQIAIASGFISDEKAVEVSVWIDSEPSRSPKRVFRLSILDTVFASAGNLVLADLQEGGRSGISCQWPLQPPASPPLMPQSNEK